MSAVVACVAPVVLAQQSPGQPGSFWLAILGLLVVTIIGFIVAMRVRAKAFQRPRLDDASFGFSELRGLRDSGQITHEEYEVAERRLRERAQDTVERVRREQATKKPNGRKPR